MGPDEVALGIVTGLLEARTGQRLSDDRHWRVESALSSILRQRGISSNQDLVVLLTQPHHGELAEQVVDELLNNETYFFRDRQLFDRLAQRTLPDLARARASTKRLSIWAAGCSTGQEPLSLAMIFNDQKARWAGWTIDIVATDVSRSVLETAQRGEFTSFQIQRGLGVSQMLAYFAERDRNWYADPSLMRMIRFQQHNVLDAPPHPGTFDLILCRNVLLYFESDTRLRALKRLGGALADDGLLMLGGGETIMDKQTGLVPVSGGSGFFTRATSAGEPLRRAG